MFLKKLEISGFKSFAKRTTLDFSQSGVFNGGKNIGITAIVGPNGSGKSNIADALRWSLGEQSMKNLRGKKSHDIIFAGSGSKSKLGSAQVSIFLDNKNKKIPLDFDEVVVTRKVFRSGEGEYLVNGSRVRLIDVVDLLAKGGVGQRSYCIINQGMADNVLNSTQLDRRAIIEEAAGVKEYQIKKDRSQRKLKNTTRNLDQVKVLMVEIEPHLRLLKRQSSKAQKGEVYRKKLKEAQEKLYGYLWYQLQHAKDQNEENKEEIGRDMMKIQREVDEIGDKLKNESKSTVSLQDQISKLEQKQRDLNHKLYSLERRIIVEEGKVELEKERAKSIKTMDVVPVGIDTIKQKISEIKSQQDSLIKRIEGIEKPSQIQELKEYARVISQELYDLYEAVVKGKIEKKKPDQEIQQQKTINLKKIHALQEILGGLKQDKEGVEKELGSIRKEVEQLLERDRNERKSSIELEDKLRRKQFELDKVKDVHNNLKIEIAKIEVREEDLRARIENEMRRPAAELKRINERVDVGELEQAIQRLKFQLEQIGGIDDTIIEEYNETQKRFDFLKKESDDLREAMKKLKKVVKEMDAQIKDRFEEAFAHINKDFGKYFKIIFNGGKASLEKIQVKSVVRRKENDEEAKIEENAEEEEDMQEEVQIGIDIIAEPPGKKISNLGMLSGGERALTSIALLFAIISHNPPPFAFLDEVEAALDEANSKRFGRILHELSGQTQFVLITHNRQTMREAAVLYGVTMSEDGISKLLSVKLDQVGAKGEIKE